VCGFSNCVAGVAGANTMVNEKLSFTPSSTPLPHLRAFLEYYRLEKQTNNGFTGTRTTEFHIRFTKCKEQGRNHHCRLVAGQFYEHLLFSVTDTFIYVGPRGSCERHHEETIVTAPMPPI
jgi:hypothetical protein